MNHFLSIGKKYFLMMLMTVCLFTYSRGQTPEWTKDPLKKPDLWAKVEKDPTDSAAWVSYYGKEWTAMTKEEVEKVTSWKFQLMLSILAKNESFIGFAINPKEMAEDFYIDDAAFKEIMSNISGEKPTTASSSPTTTKKVNKAMMRKDLASIEAIILAEDAKLKELKKNIRANFTVIEDYYKNIFKEFGIEYVYYKAKYPDSSYPEMKWVEDQEKKLQKLKQDQIAELRKKYMTK